MRSLRPWLVATVARAERLPAVEPGAADVGDEPSDPELLEQGWRQPVPGLMAPPSRYSSWASKRS